ncbi:MAG: amino acid decarboxylase, partial [Oscillospiraceae bacterium]|nr:amino acid decarboxylase [Oscillospiraceae bacterium]
GKLREFLPKSETLKARLSQKGYTLCGSEALKLTVRAKPRGYTGTQLAELLRQKDIEPEFADPDYLVLMLSAEMDGKTLLQIEEALCGIPQLPPVTDEVPVLVPGERAMPIREAMLAPSELLSVERCMGRVLAAPSVSCPPAVPILVCGERIDEHAIACFRYYGIETCFVVKREEN